MFDLRKFDMANVQAGPATPRTGTLTQLVDPDNQPIIWNGQALQVWLMGDKNHPLKAGGYLQVVRLYPRTWKSRELQFPLSIGLSSLMGYLNSGLWSPEPPEYILMPGDPVTGPANWRRKAEITGDSRHQ
jgi:hypothetical protein